MLIPTNTSILTLSKLLNLAKFICFQYLIPQDYCTDHMRLIQVKHLALIMVKVHQLIAIIIASNRELIGSY